MNMKTVKTDRGNCFAIGEVTRRPNDQLGVEVELDGRQVTFALERKEVVGYRLAEGDHVIVEFLPDDQFASVITLKTMAETFGYTVRGY